MATVFSGAVDDSLDVPVTESQDNNLQKTYTMNLKHQPHRFPVIAMYTKKTANIGC